MAEGVDRDGCRTTSMDFKSFCSSIFILHFRALHYMGSMSVAYIIIGPFKCNLDFNSWTSSGTSFTGRTSKADANSCKLVPSSMSPGDRLVPCPCAVPYDSMQCNATSRQHLIGSSSTAHVMPSRPHRPLNRWKRRMDDSLSNILRPHNSTSTDTRKDWIPAHLKTPH